MRTFLGIRQEPPRNDFRNPIWNSDDEDDGDELYERQNTDEFLDPLDINQEFTKQMNEIFKSFGSMFGDMKLFEEHLDSLPIITADQQTNTPEEQTNINNLRDYYLKPGYHSRKHDEPKDIDLDGKISSHEISGLLKRNDNSYTDHKTPVPFDGNLVPGRSFCKTIITTSVKKPDGTVETRKIVKNGNDVVEEVTTTTEPSGRGPYGSNMDQIGPMGDTGIYNHVMSELTSIFRNFY